MHGCVGHGLDHALPNMQHWREETDWFPAKTFGKAIDWLERNHGRDPFFLTIDEFDPHEPWNAPKPYLERYIETEAYRGRRIINTHGGPYPFREGELEYTLAQYAAEVTLCDKFVGDLLEKVKELGLWDETVVALVSDHGHNLMDRGVLHKLPDQMYPELMDLVYIIRSPAGEAAGSECDAYVAHHDVPVTLMSMAGIEVPEGLEGQNVWAWAINEKPQNRVFATCMFYPWIWTRDTKHVYMTHIDGASERLYDLRRDPGQEEDVSDWNPDICEELRERLRREIGGEPPRYDMVRPGHKWYEYPDIHDPLSNISRRVRERLIESE
jgi:arylsulfatase A-like enzyme